MRIMVLVIGYALAILFLLFLAKGKAYDRYVEGLDEAVFPLCTLYGVGYRWGAIPLFALRSGTKERLRRQAAMLYEPQYADYYATVAWAQMLTLVHLFLAVTFLAAGALWDSAGLILGAGLFLTLLAGVYCLENMKNTLSARTEACEEQLPEVVSTMAILTNAGMVLRDTWEMVAGHGTGPIYALMRKAGENMKNGLSDTEAIRLFGQDTNSPEVSKFTSALLQSMEKGGGELPGFLADQSFELWHARRQHMLQKGEKAATKLLLPIMIIFLGIILIIITAALAGTLF